jgi:hypothetical protein
MKMKSGCVWITGRKKQKVRMVGGITPTQATFFIEDNCPERSQLYWHIRAHENQDLPSPGDTDIIFSTTNFKSKARSLIMPCGKYS